MANCGFRADYNAFYALIFYFVWASSKNQKGVSVVLVLLQACTIFIDFVWILTAGNIFSARHDDLEDDAWTDEHQMLQRIGFYITSFNLVIKVFPSNVLSA